MAKQPSTVFSYTPGQGLDEMRHGDYSVSVELQETADGAFIPVAVTVRCVTDDGEPLPLSSREVRRLPLDRALKVAVVAKTAQRPVGFALSEALHMPRGKPTGGEHSIALYKWVAAEYRRCVLANIKSPAKEISKRKGGVPLNTVYQWIYQAREKGFLEKPVKPPRR